MPQPPPTSAAPAAFCTGLLFAVCFAGPAAAMKLPTVCLFCLLVATPLAAAELPAWRGRPQTIDAKIQIGYGLAIADVDGDGNDDVLLADAKQIVWYRNPGWEKFVIAENLTTRDNVCIAARDLDGDGKAEIAVGAEWNPNDTTNSGAVFLLEPPADRTQRWTAKKLPHEPTTHRMGWLRADDGKFSLAVLPLHGRGNKAATGEGEGVKFLTYPWPWREGTTTSALFDADAGLHQTHNFEVMRTRPEVDGPLLMVATKEGVRFLERRRDAWRRHEVSTRPAGEVRVGHAGRMFVATIEPMHGNTAAVYRAPATPDGDWSAGRVVLDESLVQGHGLAVGDLLGVGHEQIVVGWRGGGPAASKVGIKLFAAEDANGEKWKLHALIDDNAMACEDLKLADLNGDGRLDVIAAGRATKNVIIYWNETAGVPAAKSSAK
jgi:hypothetical protein